MLAPQSLVSAIIVLLTLIVLAVLLKRIGFLNKEDSSFFGKIVLHITLPALIFLSLATHPFSAQFLWLAMLVALVEIGILILAWIISDILKFKGKERGALMLVSAFGMTSMLGYPLIQQVFPGNSMAMEEVVYTSEFGVGLLLFILGPLIAIHYGAKDTEVNTLKRSVGRFIKTPIFIAIIGGVGFSFLPIDHVSPVSTTFFKILDIICSANTLLVAFTVGLIIEFKRERNILVFLLIAISLKLFLKPVMTFWITGGDQFTEMMREVVVIETALPSAILTAVFARQYDCRPDLVSAAIVITLIFSIFSTSLLSFLFF